MPFSIYAVLNLFFFCVVSKSQTDCWDWVETLIDEYDSNASERAATCLSCSNDKNPISVVISTLDSIAG